MVAAASFLGLLNEKQMLLCDWARRPTRTGVKTVTCRYDYLWVPKQKCRRCFALLFAFRFFRFCVPTGDQSGGAFLLVRAIGVEKNPQPSDSLPYVGGCRCACFILKSKINNPMNYCYHGWRSTTILLLSVAKMSMDVNLCPMTDSRRGTSHTKIIIFKSKEALAGQN